MAAKGLARVYISITTLDRDLARKLEPRAASPQRRLAAIKTLADAGIPVGVMTAPVIPISVCAITMRRPVHPRDGGPSLPRQRRQYGQLCIPGL